MRQVTLKTLRAKLTDELKNLPFEITSRGKVVGIISKSRAKIVKKVVKRPNPQQEPEKTTDCNNETIVHYY